MIQSAFVLHMITPGNNTRRGNTSFMCIMFIERERRAADICPACTVMMIGSGQTHLVEFFSGMGMVFDSGLFVETEFVPFGTSSVIGHKHDKRIVQLTVLFQFIHYPADVRVHHIYHSGKNGHTACEVGLLIFRQ